MRKPRSRPEGPELRPVMQGMPGLLPDPAESLAPATPPETAKPVDESAQPAEEPSPAAVPLAEPPQQPAAEKEAVVLDELSLDASSTPPQPGVTDLGLIVITSEPPRGSYPGGGVARPDPDEAGADRARRLDEQSAIDDLLGRTAGYAGNGVPGQPISAGGRGDGFAERFALAFGSAPADRRLLDPNFPASSRTPGSDSGASSAAGNPEAGDGLSPRDRLLDPAFPDLTAPDGAFEPSGGGPSGQGTTADNGSEEASRASQATVEASRESLDPESRARAVANQESQILDRLLTAAPDSPELQDALADAREFLATNGEPAVPALGADPGAGGNTPASDLGLYEQIRRLQPAVSDEDLAETILSAEARRQARAGADRQAEERKRRDFEAFQSWLEQAEERSRQEERQRYLDSFGPTARDRFIDLIATQSGLSREQAAEVEAQIEGSSKFVALPLAAYDFGRAAALGDLGGMGVAIATFIMGSGGPTRRRGPNGPERYNTPPGKGGGGGNTPPPGIGHNSGKTPGTGGTLDPESFHTPRHVGYDLPRPRPFDETIPSPNGVAEYQNRYAAPPSQPYVPGNPKNYVTRIDSSGARRTDFAQIDATRAGTMRQRLQNQTDPDIQQVPVVDAPVTLHLGQHAYDPTGVEKSQGGYGELHGAFGHEVEVRGYGFQDFPDYVAFVTDRIDEVNWDPERNSFVFVRIDNIKGKDGALQITAKLQPDINGNLEYSVGTGFVGRAAKTPKPNGSRAQARYMRIWPWARL